MQDKNRDADNPGPVSAPNAASGALPEGPMGDFWASEWCWRMFEKSGNPFFAAEGLCQLKPGSTIPESVQRWLREGFRQASKDDLYYQGDLGQHLKLKPKRGQRGLRSSVLRDLRDHWLMTQMDWLVSVASFTREEAAELTYASSLTTRYAADPGLLSAESLISMHARRTTPETIDPPAVGYRDWLRHLLESIQPGAVNSYIIQKAKSMLRDS